MFGVLLSSLEDHDQSCFSSGYPSSDGGPRLLLFCSFHLPRIAPSKCRVPFGATYIDFSKRDTYRRLRGRHQRFFSSYLQANCKAGCRPSLTSRFPQKTSIFIFRGRRNDLGRGDSKRRLSHVQSILGFSFSIFKFRWLGTSRRMASCHSGWHYSVRLSGVTLISSFLRMSRCSGLLSADCWCSFAWQIRKFRIDGEIAIPLHPFLKIWDERGKIVRNKITPMVHWKFLKQSEWTKLCSEVFAWTLSDL